MMEPSLLSWLAVVVSSLRKERREGNSPMTVSWPASRRPTVPVRRLEPEMVLYYNRI